MLPCANDSINNKFKKRGTPHTINNLNQLVAEENTSGYVLGVVARITKVGEVAFVYIFEKKFPFLPSEEDWMKLDPKQALLKPRVMDVLLRNGEWPILGKLKNWKREEWPMPKYIIRDEYSSYVRLDIYKESCIAEVESSKKMPLDYQEEGCEEAIFGPYGPDQIIPLVTNRVSPRLDGVVQTKKTSKKRKLPYHEGSVFAIPLNDGGYGIGVVARAASNGVILSYLFSDRYTTIPAQNELPKLDPQKALLKIRMGDLYLLNGSWTVLGDLEDWKKEMWPVPVYIQRNATVGKVWTETFWDKDVSRIGSTDTVPESFDSTEYQKSVVYDPIAVEFELTQALEHGVERPLPYHEGSVFALPLTTGVYILGVVVRTTKVGEIAIVYIFGKKYPQLPEKKEWSQLDPKDAVKKLRILDTNLQNGKWLILGPLKGFKRDLWPMPQYIAGEKGFEDAWLETYSEKDLAERLLSKKVPFDYPKNGYEEGSLFGPYRSYEVEDLMKEELLKKDLPR